MKKKLVALMVTAILGAALLTGCGSSSETVSNENASNETAAATVTEETVVPEAETETESTAAAEEETVAGAQAILVVSFGTSYNDSREATIGAIENAIAEAFPEYEVRRAFTSQIIIDKLKERDGLEIDNVEEALDRAVEDGISTLVVQPTHLMNGYEYTDLADALAEYESKFEQVVLAEPLLTSDDDFEKVADAIVNATAQYDDGETAICYMGHGTEADSNTVYAKMQEVLTNAGYENYVVGTVEAEPSIEDVVAAIKANDAYKKVVLRPLMVVAGDHANNDMAGDEEGSWKTTFDDEGFEVECLIKGLGEIEAVQDIYVSHVKEAINAFNK